MPFTASDTLRIPAYSALCFSGICRYFQAYSALLRHIHTHWDIIQPYSAPYVTVYSQLYISFILALAHLEPGAYLKPCKMLTRNIQKPAVRHYSALFRHIHNLVQHLHTQKPGILGIQEYSEPLHNCIPTNIPNPVI